MKLGERIKMLRIKRGLTQLELANILFVSDRTISKWEQQRGNPDIDTLPQLSEALGVSLDFLLTGKEYIPTIDDNVSAAITYFESLIGEPLENEYLRRTIAKTTLESDIESVKNAMDICYGTYLSKIDKPIDSDCLRDAISKIGGIIHNQSLSPVDKKISHIIYYLAKNTYNCTGYLKYKCENTFRNMLLSLDDEKKIEFLDRIYKICVEKHLDLNDAIGIAENTIEIRKRKEETAKQILNGYLDVVEHAPKFINDAIDNINDLLIRKNVTETSDAILDLLDKLMKYVFTKIDDTLVPDDIPFITGYYMKIHDILGRFISRSLSSEIKRIVTKYDNDVYEIELSDLDFIRVLIQILLKKVKHNIKSGRNNFNKKILLN